MDTSDHTQTIVDYITAHPMTVLSTVGAHNVPHGAAIFTCALDDPSGLRIYFLTKDSTKKFTNIKLHPTVCLTYADEKEASTLQVTGMAEALHNNPHLLDRVMKRLATARNTVVDWLPPIAKITDGEYQIVGIDVQAARLGQFGKNITIGDERLFTEL